MMLLLFADPKEAAPSLDLLRAKQCDEGYCFEGGRIVITGWGKQAGGVALRYGQGATIIYNLGFAATLHDDPLFSLHRVLSAHLIDNQGLTLNNAGKRLLSVDTPLHDSALRKQLSLRWDLIDMEGYSIAQAAEALNKPCQLWKIVSDTGEEGASATIRQHTETLSLLLAKKAKELVENNHLIYIPR